MSEIRANTISDAAGTGPIDLHKQSAAKAWVSLQMLYATQIDDSFNVAGMTDVGTGNVTVTFTSAFNNPPASVCSAERSANYVGLMASPNQTASTYVSVGTAPSTGAAVDAERVLVASFGDLA